MSDETVHLVRRGGRFEDEGGRVTTWSVAGGSRGRRWRWVTVGPGVDQVAAHTLETTLDARFNRLESAGQRGLLTLHVEPDGRVHGHRVTGGGVEHVALGVPASGLALVGTGPVGDAAFVSGIGQAAEPVRTETLIVTNGLGVEVAEVVVRPLGRRAVEIEVAGVARRLELDGDGLPVVPGGDAWPLELDGRGA